MIKIKIYICDSTKTRHVFRCAVAKTRNGEKKQLSLRGGARQDNCINMWKQFLCVRY